jgi:chaperonin GroEL
MPRTVAVDRVLSDKLPEILDDGGTIVRRIIEIPDRDADVGAMFVRQMLWQLREDVGDGTATAAVLFQTVYNEGVRYITAGGNAMMLRHHLLQGLGIILDTLAKMAVPVEGKEELAQIAESICYDPPLANILGEIFDIIGEYGRLEVRSGAGRGLEREYVEGMYWNEGVLSRSMLYNPDGLRTDMENTAVLISDFSVEDPRPLAPIVEWAMESESASLLVIARELPKKGLGLLLTASDASDDFQVVAVKLPGSRRQSQAAALEDLAILTGGRAFIEAAGQTLESVKPAALGRVRRAWADRFSFGIVGGQGHPQVLRAHIKELREAFEQTEESNYRRELRERIGKLMGGSATLRVGGVTRTEADERKELAKRTGEAMRAAIRRGALPGGGVALWACRSSLTERLDKSSESNERAAHRILLRALEEPIRTIIRNTGYDPGEVLAHLKLAGSGYGFDARSGHIVNVIEAGILDVADVQQKAVEAAIRSAALALTVDVLVHRKNFKRAMKP